ncbi:MAG: tyrosine-type recombinase/integrase [Clostridiales bacterium]|jgi:integrase|nr:tyrosine-type recombinase/integrase [Clostridiales bacterium]
MKAATKIIGPPKSDDGIRFVPITDTLYPALFAARKTPFEPVFTQPTTGRRHTISSMSCLWDNFKRELDISMGAKVYRNEIILSLVAQDLVPYCLRHTYGTDLQDAGVPINVARYLMGHSDIALTSKVYTDTTEYAIKDALEKMNQNEKRIRKIE